MSSQANKPKDIDMGKVRGLVAAINDFCAENQVTKADGRIAIQTMFHAEIIHLITDLTGCGFLSTQLENLLVGKVHQIFEELVEYGIKHMAASKDLNRVH